MSSNLPVSSWPVCHCFDECLEHGPRPEPPNFATILSSNDAPVGWQLDELNAKLAAGEQNLAAMEKMLLDLSRQRHDLQRDMDSWRSAIHPIRRIPNEILSEIFLHCRDDYLDTVPNSIDSSKCPWTISRVSRRWRNVAIGLASLWSFIRIEIPEGFDFASARAKRWPLLLEQQLIRSGCNSMDVSMFSQCEIPRNHSLWTVLFPTSHQWKSLTLYVPLNTFQQFAEDLKGSLGILEFMDIGFTAVEPMTVATSTITFGAMPQLTTLTTFPEHLSFIDLPFDQILHYDSDTPGSPPAAALDALERLTQLQTCTIRCDEGVDHPVRPRMIHLPDLQSLQIKDEPNETSIAEVLENLKLPSLQNLILNTSFLDLECLAGLVELSSCRLQHLTVLSTALNEDNTRLLLEIFPELVSLTISGPGDMKHLLKLLWTQEKVVPKLQTLIFRGPASSAEQFSLAARPNLLLFRLPARQI
ncbi:hypothetical protein C8J56DRAFT_860794 [Mycena floridula]|nr:hypothetical protein C8J56DRAFT_860794 [Mycena floridula]